MQFEGQRIPNFTHPSVPVGGEENAAVVTLVGARTHVRMCAHVRTTHSYSAQAQLPPFNCQGRCRDCRNLKCLAEVFHLCVAAVPLCRCKHDLPPPPHHPLQVGCPPVFDGFQPKDHVAVAEALDLVDFDTAAEVRCSLSLSLSLSITLSLTHTQSHTQSHTLCVCGGGEGLGGTREVGRGPCGVAVL